MEVLGYDVEHRVVGTQHLYTSPALPGLYVAHADQATAERNIAPAIEMLIAMARRRDEEKRVQGMIAAG